MEPPPGEDEGALVLVVRTEHLAGEPHLFYQLHRPVFLREIAVGSAFDGEPADLFRAELPADGLFLFKEGKVQPLFLQVDGAGEGGDPPADDGRFLHPDLLSFIRVILDKHWTPAPVPDCDPGFAGVTTFYWFALVTISFRALMKGAPALREGMRRKESPFP